MFMRLMLPHGVYAPAHALRTVIRIRRLFRPSLQTVLYRGLASARFTRLRRLRTLALGPVSSLGWMDESLEPKEELHARQTLDLRRTKGGRRSLCRQPVQS